MHSEWDESYFDAPREDPSIYWVCFWTGDDIEEAARHDPQRITGADSVVQVLEWVYEVKEERRFELFVETAERVGTSAHGSSDRRTLIRLAGDFTSGGTTCTTALYAEE
ncbi:hypothetical protein [Microbacterium sp. lyk4-40-TSB-66]|uniref:hypothetical protein n=1 Tax=Microbacterium sp. lyk4-40-TSB-66 TaxID=3040294 RepID=UPI00254E7D15|nr:hypothetical protein [Microbacterium sp. lyk4-40-TSB-66]